MSNPRAKSPHSLHGSDPSILLTEACCRNPVENRRRNNRNHSSENEIKNARSPGGEQPENKKQVFRHAIHQLLAPHHLKPKWPKLLQLKLLRPDVAGSLTKNTSRYFPSCRKQLFFASGTWKAAKATASDRHNKITFVSVVQAFPHKKPPIQGPVSPCNAVRLTWSSIGGMDFHHDAFPVEKCARKNPSKPSRCL